MRVLILGGNYGLLIAAYLHERGIPFDIYATENESIILNKNGFRFFYNGDVCSTIKPDILWSAFSERDPIRQIKYDLMIFAMQEPTYSQHNVENIIKLYKNSCPILSIMNIPPPSFITHNLGLNQINLSDAYTSYSLFQSLSPAQIIYSSPEPQIFLEPNSGLYHIRLGGVFRCSSFDVEFLSKELAQLILKPLANSKLPLEIKTYSSPWVSVSKFPMLITGNYRCISNGILRSINEAVLDDSNLAEKIYAEVVSGMKYLGAPRSAIVPFGKYLVASRHLTAPSSVARSILAGKNQVERTDKLLRNIFRAYQIKCLELDKVVSEIDLAIEKYKS